MTLRLSLLAMVRELPVSVAQIILDYVPYNERILNKWSIFVREKRYLAKIDMYNWFHEYIAFYDRLFYRTLEVYGVAVWRPYIDDV